MKLSLRGFYTVLHARAWLFYELFAQFVYVIYCTCMNKLMFFYKQFAGLSTCFLCIPENLSLREFYTVLRTPVLFVYTLCTQLFYVLFRTSMQKQLSFYRQFERLSTWLCDRLSTCVMYIPTNAVLCLSHEFFYVLFRVLLRCFSTYLRCDRPTKWDPRNPPSDVFGRVPHQDGYHVFIPIRPLHGVDER